MLVSVVIPTHRRHDYLAEALRSVCSQTHQDFEAVVVNDCPQETAAVEDVLSQLDDRRVRAVHHSHNQGPAACRNTGVQATSGDVIAFLDDDDYWLPDKLARHVAVHQSDPSIGVAYSGCIRVWPDDKLPPKVRFGSAPPHDIIAAMRRNEFCPELPTVGTVRRQFFLDVGGFDHELTQFEDWDMLYRLAMRCRFAAIEEPLAVVRQHLGSRVTTSGQARADGVRRLLAKWPGELDDSRFIRYYIPLARFVSVQNLIFSGHRWRALREMRKLTTMKIDVDLVRREIPKTLLLFAFGVFTTKLIMNTLHKASFCRRETALD